jgi:hypothetical protein
MERRDRLRKVLAMMDEDDREAVLGAAPPCPARTRGMCSLL